MFIKLSLGVMPMLFVLVVKNSKFRKKKGKINKMGTIVSTFPHESILF